MSAVWGSSAFLGPLIGGVFASIGLWRFGFWAFAFQAVILVVALLFLLKSPPKPQDNPRRRVPFLRLAIFSAGVLAIATAGVEVSLRTSPWLGVLAVLLLLMFFKLDDRASDGGLLPHGSLNVSRPVGAGIVMVLTTATATISFTVYGPILMKSLYGTGPLVAGYMIAVESISWSLAAVVFSGVTPLGERTVIRVGSILVTVAVAGLAIAMPYGSLLSLVPFLVFAGAGLGMAYGFIIRRVVAHAHAGEKEKASSAIPTIHWMGYAIGSAASGIVANSAGFADGITVSSAQSAGFWVFAAFLPLALIGNFSAWRLTSHPAV